MSPPRSVLVIGANGYIGSAVCRAFVRAGWHVYGLVRKPEAAQALLPEEVVPIVGLSSDDSDIGFIDHFFRYTKSVDAIVVCTEPSDYVSHFNRVVTLLSHIAETSNPAGVRPLVLWSSGCKDYGTTAVDGAAGLKPHTESSPTNPPPFVAARTAYSLKVLEHTDLFDAAVLRPTNVYGYSSSFYGLLFRYAATSAAAAASAAGASTLKFSPDPKTILHAMHVDDCAEAYVALAEHSERKAVAGQCFNLSAYKYETAGVIARALAMEYGFSGGAEFVHPDNLPESNSQATQGAMMTLEYSQWVGSEKVRALTGWADRRMLFSENLHVYRAAYEAAADAAHGDVTRTEGRMAAWTRS